MSTRTAEAPSPAAKLMQGVKVVDTDTHITEWPDLWTSRASAKYRDRVPQVKRVNGKPTWVIDGYELFGVSGFSAIKKDGSKLPGLEFFDLGFDDVHAGSHDVKARVRYMDEMGIAAQVGYPNILGFGGRKAIGIDPEIRLVATQILNDAYAELQEQSNNRLYPMAMIPWWDIDLAVAEAKRCAKMGLRGINTHANPEIHNMPDLGETYWDPLWDVCEDLKLPVNFHIGFSEGAAAWRGTGYWKHADHKNLQYVANTVMLFTGNTHVMVNLLLSDIFTRHPSLKFVSVESAVGWVPFILEQLSIRRDDGDGRSRRADPRVVPQALLHLRLVREKGHGGRDPSPRRRQRAVRDRLPAPHLLASEAAQLSAAAHRTAERRRPPQGVPDQRREALQSGPQRRALTSGRDGCTARER
jgi:predicted TIM-barrel fold metal-dependent hydrolase